jgi:glutaredoxin
MRRCTSLEHCNCRTTRRPSIRVTGAVRIRSTEQSQEERKTMTEVSKPTIVAYLKPVCGWSNGVRAVFRKYELEYDDKDIINDRSNYSEMVRKSGQPLSPCVEIDGEMLADVSGQEVEQYLVEKGMVNPAAVSAGA